MKLHEKYLVTEAVKKVGDWVKQKRSDGTTYAVIVDVLKNGSYKVLKIDTDRDIAVLASSKGWYPDPVDSSASEVPPALFKKMKTKLAKTKWKSVVTL